jgi:uncharacterized protein (DUF433 family)
MTDFYDRDPREFPIYGIIEASHYLSIPIATLQVWIKGRRSRIRSGRQVVERITFERTIEVPDPKQPLLSFMNLVEAHVLDALRRIHGIPMQRIRKAVKFLSKKMNSTHPLVEEGLRTNDVDLFYNLLDQNQLVSISKWQLAFREIVEPSLHRIEHDAEGLAKRLFPFTRSRISNSPRLIVIDPLISFGKPIIEGSGIPTEMVAERYKAGESMDELAEDYGFQRIQIEEAIRYEIAA